MASKSLTEPQQEVLSIIGKNMRDVRKLRGWTQEYMERRGFSSYTFYQSLEAGKKNMTINTFMLACTALDTTPNRLLKGVKY